MTAKPTEPHGQPHCSVLGFAPSGRMGLARRMARWRALPGAVVAAVRRPPSVPVAHWVLARENGGWVVRAAGDDGAPAYFTIDVPLDDQNAAFDWAAGVTPDVERKRISYVGPPPA